MNVQVLVLSIHDPTTLHQGAHRHVRRDTFVADTDPRPSYKNTETSPTIHKNENRLHRVYAEALNAKKQTTSTTIKTGFEEW